MKDPKWELDRLEFAPRSSAHKHVQKFERLVNKIWEGQEMDPKYKWDLFASTLERSKGWSNGRGITPGKWIHVIEERAPMSYEQVKIAFLETWGKNDRSKLGHNRESSHESAGDFALVQVTPPNAPYSDQSDSERERSGRGQSLDIQAEEGKIVLSFNQNGKRSSKNPSKITLEFKPEKALPAPKQVEAPPPPPPPPAALPAAPLPPSHPYSDSESEPESMLMEENKQYQRDQPPAPAPPPHMTPPAPYPPTPAAGAAPEAPQAPMAPPPPSHTPQPPPQGHPHYQYYQQPYQTPQGEHPPPLQSNPQTPYQQPPPPPQPQQQQQQPGPDQHPQDRPQYQQHNSYHFPPDRGYTPGPPPDRGYTPGPPPDRGYTPAPELRTPYYDHPAPPKSDRPSYEMDIRKLAPSPGPLLARTPSPVTLPDSTAPPTRPRLLENKVIAITGAGRGIGRALALGFAREGAHIIAHYFNSPTSPNQDDIVALCVEIRSLGQGCTIVFGDISDPKTSETIVRKAVEQYGHLDVAVSNAGVCEYAEMEDVTPDQWLRHVDVNLSGGYFFVQAAAAQMKKQFLAAQAEAAEDGANREPDDASIICISSSGGVSPGRQTHFLPTSAGLQALMRSSAVALGKFGIRCNSILVGVVRTKMVREELKEGGREKVEEGVPLGRLGRAEDVVGPACMLAGEMGRWVTGAEIRVDGGMGVFSG
ncbi:NAD(P)-binding protein [Ascobolus immersus RN42]|uniref:NAD(P)-binding protein n=1 Tax=Ascobolus immersus RN42 TaxID=1160509 RepID=A0A3N4HGS2_ASCIM|nr:NAD(P)-binding protein [Ascobolus immersus RN42]